jgi:hypothetical protein
MKENFPYTQIRIARPTSQLDKVIDFYKNGLGLSEISRFKDHDGYSGAMFGLPDAQYHLEFTEHTNDINCDAPSKDNLLVFYLSGIDERNEISERLFNMGYKEVDPKNPYWKTNGITIEDPDKWRIVLMHK